MAEIFWADLAASYEILKTIFVSVIKDDFVNKDHIPNTSQG